jgi:hypothetical protein
LGGACPNLESPSTVDHDVPHGSHSNSASRSSGSRGPKRFEIQTRPRTRARETTHVQNTLLVTRSQTALMALRSPVARTAFMARIC